MRDVSFITELNEKLSQFQWLWRKKKHRRYAAHGVLSDKTSGQGRVVALLKIQDGISIKEIAYLLDINYSSLNELLGKLEKNDYITKETSESDKRVTIIKLTDKGKAEPKEPIPEGSESLFSVLNGNEQAAFGKCLDKLIVALQEELQLKNEDIAKQMQEWRLRQRF